jgi:hypothetical protein
MARTPVNYDARLRDLRGYFVVPRSLSRNKHSRNGKSAITKAWRLLKAWQNENKNRVRIITKKTLPNHLRAPMRSIDHAPRIPRLGNAKVYAIPVEQPLDDWDEIYAYDEQDIEIDEDNEGNAITYEDWGGMVRVSAGIYDDPSTFVGQIESAATSAGSLGKNERYFVTIGDRICYNFGETSLSRLGDRVKEWMEQYGSKWQAGDANGNPLAFGVIREIGRNMRAKAKRLHKETPR